MSEGAPAATLTPTCAKRGGVYLDQEAQQTAIIFGADGKYVGTLRNGDKHLSNGAYTVVVSNTVYNTFRWSSYFKYFSGTVEGSAVAYLKAAGQTLTIYFDDGLKKTYIATVHVPAQSFSLDSA